MLWRGNNVARREEPRQPRRIGGWLRVLLFVAAALFLAGMLYTARAGLRVYGAYEDLQEGKSLLLSAEATLRAGGLETEPSELEAAEDRVLEARDSLRSAHDTLEGEPLVRAGRRLPWLGDQLDALLGLASIGLYSTDIGLTGIAVLREFDSARQRQDGNIGDSAAAFLEGIEPEIEVVDAKAAAIARVRSQIAAPLLPPLAGVVDAVDDRMVEVREMTQRYRHARAAVGALLGMDGSRRYLVLGQDNTELFPTGGIIALYGTVTLEDGRLVQRSFRSAIRLVDEGRAGGAEYVQPPGPLDDYLLHGWAWNFVLSNWSPDFPTAARQALRFYEEAGGEPVDGVIGIDFDTLAGLLALTGPLTLEEYGLTLDEGDVKEALQLRTHRPQGPWEGDYAVAVAAASRILDAAFALPSDQGGEVFGVLERLAREKHLFVYSREEPVQAALAGLGWDGALAALASDYLMPVEASVHSTKLNLVVQREMDVRVELDRDGTARNRVALRYRNGLDEWARGRDPDLVAALMLEGFYGGYLRLLVPPQAVLEEVAVDGRAAGVEEVSVDAGRLSFGRYFPLPRGASREVSFSYSVPGAAAAADGENEYRLHIQKQGGLEAPALRIAVTLPEGAEVRRVTLDGAQVPGSPLEIATDLSRDRELVVRYRK